MEPSSIDTTTVLPIGNVKTAFIFKIYKADFVNKFTA